MANRTTAPATGAHTAELNRLRRDYKGWAFGMELGGWIARRDPTDRAGSITRLYGESAAVLRTLLDTALQIDAQMADRS